MKLTLPLRFKQGKQNILYSLNNFLIPVGTEKTINTYWTKRAKDHLMKLATEQCEGHEMFKDRVKLTLTIYRDSNRLMDIGNFSIIEKYVTDALVKAEVLADDNWKFVAGVSIMDGGVDKENPRAEYLIEIIP